MSTYVVKQGECIATIAEATGFSADTLYNHPDNADLKKKRPNPNILHPGDEVAIPAREVKTVTVKTGAVHQFRVALPKRELQLTLLDREGKPIGGESYVLEVDGESIEGQTSGGGEIKQSIKGNARSVTLTIGERLLTLDCSSINPLTDAPDDGASGARERLHNLGYDVGEASGDLDAGTRTALALFQHESKLEVTGNLDEATRSKLAAAHRC